MTASAALRRIARSCTEQIVQNEPAVLAGLPDGIHQMRVGVRRLRAILSAFAPLLPENEYHWFSDELRWLGGVLGLARNLDVFADSFVAPAIKCIGDTPRSGGAEQRRRRAARCRLCRCGRGDRFAPLHRSGVAPHALFGR